LSITIVAYWVHRRRPWTTESEDLRHFGLHLRQRSSGTFDPRHSATKLEALVRDEIVNLITMDEETVEG
jgi:hypothetical protein